METEKEGCFMMYASIFLFLLMLLLYFLFGIVSVLRLGIPLLFALLAGLLFPEFDQEHETLTTIIFFVLLGLAALSWVMTIRRRNRFSWRQKQYGA